MNASEIILSPSGKVYHLNISSADVAEKVILVGDPARVDKVKEHFDAIRFESQKREFRICTGTFKGQSMSIVSTGIGTDNIDIVLHELDMAWNLKEGERTYKEEKVSAKILRFGTCGSIQTDVPVGSQVFSRFALGGDNLLSFYQRPSYPLRETLEDEINKFNPDLSKLPFSFYGAICHSSIWNLIQEKYPSVLGGITYTAPGFYGPQARATGRTSLKVPEFLRHIASFSFRDLRVLNMEMETAGILGMAELLGHQAGSLSAVLANRRTGNFAENPAKEVDKLIQTGLSIIHDWN
ncbi:MAG: nucleoside phosphorylase [Bacteroidota bacterium]